jgi:hypothetical protein
MRILAVLVAFTMALAPQARSRKAHEHGEAKVNIAFETTKGSPKGVIEFEAPAESIVGFEYQARTAADQAKMAAALNTLKTRFSEMVILPAASQCKIVARSADVKSEAHNEKKKGGAKPEEHSEVHAMFDVQCAQPLAGKEIRFGFSKVFPRVHEAEVSLLAGEQQSGLDVKQDKGTLRIAQ